MNGITNVDVINVANDLGMDITDDHISEVLRRFDSEANNDPTATWDLIVENILYSIIANCLNCGHSQTLSEENVKIDNLGRHLICEQCESSFDVD